MYITGFYDGTVDFDPGPSTFTMTTNGSSGDVFIQKLDANGNFIWAKSMGGTSAKLSRSITTDASGNVYITGYFESSVVDFDPGPGTFNLSSNGLKDVFIQKLDALGNFVWAKSMGGTSNDLSYSITTDASGNV
ncbi:MAG: SBBP repeat-containing protein, partial [Flavobacteriales bacterium]|nr:SBBP repeat-containing protein [Flavobacteriales bacterium]